MHLPIAVGTVEQVWSVSGLAQTIPRPRPAAHSIVVLGGRAGAWAGDAIPACPEMN